MKFVKIVIPCILLFSPVQTYAQTDIGSTEISQKESQKLMVLENGKEVEDVLYLFKDSWIEIRKTEEINEIQVWIDGVLVPVQEKEEGWRVPVQYTNQEILIQYEKSQEESALRKIQVHSLQKLKAQSSVSYGEYILQNSVTLHFDSLCEEDVVLCLYINEEKIQEYLCQGKEEVQVDLNQSGKVRLDLYYQHNPEHKILINDKRDLSFYFTNKDIELDISNQEKISNHDIELHIAWPNDLKEGFVQIDDGQDTLRYNPEEDVVLRAKSGQRLQYHVLVYAQDHYGRNVYKTVSYIIDQKIPVISLYHHEKLVNPGVLNVYNEKNDLSFLWDKEVNSSFTCFVNHQQVEAVNLNQLWQSLHTKDILTISFLGIDEAGNKGVYPYYLQYVEPSILVSGPTAKNPTVMKQEPKMETKSKTIVSKIQSPIMGSYSDVQITERIWKRFPDQKLKMEKKTETIDHTKPIIRLLCTKGSMKELKKGDTIRITLVNTQSYSKDRFKKLTINGKKVNVNTLKKDNLNNDYYEFVLNRPTTNIEAIAVDHSGNQTTFKKTLSVSDKNQAIWIIPVCLGLIALVIAAGYRAYAMSQDHNR